MKNRLSRVEVFWGKVVAGYTHEMKNILATISESAGFIEDIHRLGKEGDTAYRDKIVHSLKIVQQQVERGETLSGFLNYLAHSPDQEVSQVSLNETLSAMVGLYQRFARRKKVDLELENASPGMSILTNQVVFMHLIFAALEWLMQGIVSSGKILIRCSQEGNASHIEFLFVGEVTPRAAHGEYWDLLGQLASVLEGRVFWDASQSGLIMTLEPLSDSHLEPR